MKCSCSAEEEEEVPSSGSPQPATITGLAGEEEYGPPHARAADNSK